MKFCALIVWFPVIGLLGGAGDASAQNLTLHIDNGLVVLDASNVTVNEILARWTAVTGLSVVSKNGAGSDVPVTLRLSGVSEREALRTVLRDLSGYIMGERHDPRTGLVSVDRLLILPESAAQAPAAAMPGPAATGRRSPFQPGAPSAPPIVEPAIVAAPSETDTPVELAPAPGRSGAVGAGWLIGSGRNAVLDLMAHPDENRGDVAGKPRSTGSGGETERSARCRLVPFRP